MERSEALNKLIGDQEKFPVSIMKVTRASMEAGDYEDGPLDSDPDGIVIDKIDEAICDAARLANTEHYKNLECWPELQYCGSELDICNENERVLEIHYSTMVDELQFVEDKQGKLPDDFVVDWKFFVHLGEMDEELAREIEDYLT